MSATELSLHLTTDPAWRGDHFAEKPVRGLQAMGRVYAGWALSQAFYRERLYEKIGYPTIENFLVENWEANYLRREAFDPNYRADVGGHYISVNSFLVLLPITRGST